MADRVKPIVIHDNDHKKDYTLEFNRESVKFAEGRGFVLEDVDRFPMTKIPEFFWYAFRMHHPKVSLRDAEDILYKVGGLTDELAKRLGELYAAPFESMAPDEDEAKNFDMTMDL